MLPRVLRRFAVVGARASVLASNPTPLGSSTFPIATFSRLPTTTSTTTRVPTHSLPSSLVPRHFRFFSTVPPERPAPTDALARLQLLRNAFPRISDDMLKTSSGVATASRIAPEILDQVSLACKSLTSEGDTALPAGREFLSLLVDLMEDCAGFLNEFRNDFSQALIAWTKLFDSLDRLDFTPVARAKILTGLGTTIFSWNMTERFGEAERYLLDALAIRRKEASGKKGGGTAAVDDHVDIAKSLNFLGVLYFKMGPAKFAESEKMYLESLEMRRRLHIGKDHIDIASLLNNLGTLYVNMNPPRFTDAEKMLSESLAMQRRLLPPNAAHVAIAASLNNLGSIYFKMRPPKFAQAEKLLKEGLEMQRKLLPSDHLDIAQSLNNLGIIYASAQKELGPHSLENAEKMFRQGLEMRRRLLPPEHLEIAQSLAFFGHLHAKMGPGKKVQAQSMLKESLAILDKNFPGHPLANWIRSILPK